MDPSHASAIALAAIFGPPMRRVEDAALELGVDPDVLSAAALRGLEALPGIERAVIAMRYGLGRDRATLAEAASELGVSRERVRQCEVSALRRLGYLARRDASRN